MKALQQATQPAASARPIWVGTIVALLITAAMGCVVYRVASLQIAPDEQLASLTGTQVSHTPIPARRGSIMDRQGRPLAVSRTALRLFADPGLIEDVDAFAAEVGAALGLAPREISRTIVEALRKRPESRYVVLAPRLSDARADRMASVEIRGLGVQRWLVRDYPQDTLAGQVLGFVGADGEGLEGIERLYDDRLAGREGRISWLRDVRHRPIWADGANYRPPVDGKPVRLSIDAVIQAIAEQALAEACRKFDAPRGEVVVMRPTTGEILAMANYPFFAPDEYRRSKPEDWRNRAVTDTFEPGSTFKPFIWTIATTLGYAQLDEMIDCTEAGVYRFESGRRLHDSHGNGILSWEDVLVESSNIGMGIVGTRMGNERMYAAIRAFGFGELTHSHLPGEVAGILHPVRNWSKYSITSLPMGHEIGVTNLQIVRGYCTFANGGFLVRPTILAVDPSQPTVPVYQRVLDPQTVMTVQRALQRVVLEGTGTRARSEKYRIMGKTGTTQLVDAIHGGYVPGKYVSGFVGIAPATKPELSIGCFIHESDRRKGYYGGTVAAPVVKTIVEESLEYMGVPYDPPLMPESTPLAHVTGD